MCLFQNFSHVLWNHFLELFLASDFVPLIAALGCRFSIANESCNELPLDVVLAAVIDEAVDHFPEQLFRFVFCETH